MRQKTIARKKLPVTAASSPFSSPVIHKPTSRELRRIQETLERILIQDLVPFYFPATLDWVDGGYRLNHDGTGKWRGPGRKNLLTQSRTLWFYSRLYNSPYGHPDQLEAARHGFVFLRDKMRNKRTGQSYAEVSSNGEKSFGPASHEHATTLLYALSEFGSASKDKQALSLAADQMRWIAQQSRTQSKAESIRSLLPMLESVSAYYRLTGNPVAKAMLMKLLLLQAGAGLKAAKGKNLSYGGEMESIWLTIEGMNALGLSNNTMRNFYAATFARALKGGFDKNHGGFYTSRTDTRKLWWVQAESLLGSLWMYRLTGAPVAYNCFKKTLDWVAQHQVDWKNGDWHFGIKKSGTVFGDKAGLHKSPFHQARALLHCLELLIKFN